MNRSRRQTPVFQLRTQLWMLVALTAALFVGLAGIAQARQQAAIPSTNLTQNPTFKYSTRGWHGLDATLKRVGDRRAPDGHTAGRLVAGDGIDEYWLNGDPAKLADGSVSGERYTGSAWVRGTARTAGTKVDLVVRETTPAGDLVVDQLRTVTLRRHYRKVAAKITARDAGDTIDLYLRRQADQSVSNDSFYADALTVTDTDLSNDQPASVPDGAAPNTLGQIAIISSQEDALRAMSGSEYRYLVVRDSMHRYVDDLRAANPDSQILLYKDLSFVFRDEGVKGCPYAPYEVSGISYCTADSHESWFLHDKNGQRLTSESYGNLYAMNLTDPGYRQAWLDSVRSRLVDAEGDGSGVHWDGVYMDDTNLYPGHGMGGRIRELTDAQYREATLSFVGSVSPALQADGFTTMANVGMDMYDPPERDAAVQLAKTIDVYNREFFIRWSGTGVFSAPGAGNGNDWTDELTHMEAIERAGASFTAVVYGGADEIQVQRYARATFLLGWDGKDGSALFYRAEDDTNGYLPDWTTDVGFPTGARYKVGNAYRRDFQTGTVLVNPDPASTQSIELGGSYQVPGGQCVTSVKLPPRQALVLSSC
ncbi:MAG: hypothetical protein QOI10_1511 [Solirubrobacterales bacterium]|jgi:hypothetical protein|nr:hypothetical protein [Solirubrobacterales bacterium]